jgi:hypothetical protein
MNGRTTLEVTLKFTFSDPITDIDGVLDNLLDSLYRQVYSDNGFVSDNDYAVTDEAVITARNFKGELMRKRIKFGPPVEIER